MDTISKYYINLNRSESRRKIMEGKYSELTRIEAFDGKRITSYDNIVIPDKTRSTNLELGCAFSHLKAIITAYQNNEDEVIILEDDIYPDYQNQWRQSLRSIIDQKPKDTECLILHCINPYVTKKLIGLSENYCNYIRYKRIYAGAGCYYLTRSGMEKIYQKYYKNNKYDLNQYKSQTHAADHGIIYRVVNTYYYTKPLFNHQFNNSTLHTENLKRHKLTFDIIDQYFKGTLDMKNDKIINSRRSTTNIRRRHIPRPRPRSNTRPRPRPRPEPNKSKSHEVISQERKAKAIRIMEQRRIMMEKRKKRIEERLRIQRELRTKYKVSIEKNNNINKENNH